MSQATPAEWHRTVVAIEDSIGQCLAALDRYEQTFSRVLSDAPRDAPRVSEPIEPVPEPAWDDRLALTARHADEVEQLLARQEADWRRWQEMFQDWKQLLGSRSSSP